MRKTILFDMDGTVLNTLADLAGSTNATLRAHDLPQHTIDEVRMYVGNGVSKLMERAIPQGLEHPHFVEYLEEFKQHYAAHMNDQTCPYEGILEMLQQLKTEGFRLGVVSNKFDQAVKELSEHYFGDLMEVAIGETERIHKKPAPDTVFEALKELGCTTEDAVYVGDSDVDIQTAANAGIPCISVTWGFRSREFLLEHGASRLVDCPATLVSVLMAKQNS